MYKIELEKNEACDYKFEVLSNFRNDHTSWVNLICAKKRLNRIFLPLRRSRYKIFKESKTKRFIYQINTLFFNEHENLRYN